MIREDPRSTVDELEDARCEYFRGEFLRRRQLASQIIYKVTRWAMVVFLAQDFNKGQWGPPFVLLTRWVKRGRANGGRWIKKKDFALRPGQAAPVLAVAAGWEAMAAQLNGIGVDVGKAVVEAERGA